jgi:hypothetical protein
VIVVSISFKAEEKRTQTVTSARQVQGQSKDSPAHPDTLRLAEKMGAGKNDLEKKEK